MSGVLFYKLDFSFNVSVKNVRNLFGVHVKKTVVPASSHQFCRIIPPEEVITRRDQLKSKASKTKGSAKGDGNEEGGKKRPSKAKAKAKSSRKSRSCN